MEIKTNKEIVAENVLNLECFHYAVIDAGKRWVSVNSQLAWIRRMRAMGHNDVVLDCLEKELNE